MSGQPAALVGSHLSDRRRSLLAWGLPLGLWSAFIVIIFPSVEEALSKAVQNYPDALKEAFGIGQLTSVEQYLQAEMLSLIVPLAMGYLAVRAISSGLAGAAESGRLDVLLSAPVSRARLVAAGFAATAVELAVVLAVTVLLTCLGSVVAGAHLSFSSALTGYSNVWPLALFSAGLGAVAAGFSLRTSVVTGSVAGALVSMYVIDLIGRLDPDLSGIRYISVFKYYGNAVEDGIDPLAFVGVTVAAVGLVAIGAWLFERRTSPARPRLSSSRESQRNISSTAAGATTSPPRIRNQGWPASLPALIECRTASSQKIAVRRCTRRQRAAPMRSRK